MTVRPVRFQVLDALRGVLAMTVALGHVGMPPLFGAMEQNNFYWSMAAKFWRTLAFGPPAVIAFFVISGFCIHYLYVGPDASMSVLRFYGRRYLRICLPIVVVAALYFLYLRPGVWPFGRDGILWNSTLWSLLCEEIYYAVYPLLLFAARRLGIKWILFASVFPCILALWITYPAVEWTDLGVFGTTIVLAPVWLSGAVLAEEAFNRKIAPVSVTALVAWRVGAWIVMWLALVLHFHLGFHQTASSVLIGIFAYFWLRAELSRGGDARPAPALVWLGAWSYSLYLTHPLVVLAVSKQGLDRLESVTTWTICMAAVILASYVFFLLIEAPSHRFARRISLRSSLRAAAPAPATSLSAPL